MSSLELLVSNQPKLTHWRHYGHYKKMINCHINIIYKKGLNVEYQCIASDVKLGKDVKIYKFVNLYGCAIDDGTKIGAFVEIQKNAKIGKNCKISSHTFICEGVIIEDNVFIGHGVMFINDKYPRAANPDGSMQTESDWNVVPTTIKKGASIGSGATVLCGVTIGENAIIGAGAVVTKNIPANVVAVGVPARVMRKIK